LEPFDLGVVFLLRAVNRHRDRPRQIRTRPAHWVAAPRPPSPPSPPASSAASASVFPRRLVRGFASRSSAGASQCSSADTAMTPHAGAPRGGLVDKCHVRRLPVALGIGDLEADLEAGAAALRSFALGKAVAED